MDHSRLSPSAAGRWVHCPGAVIMGEQFPEPEGRNEAADEGTASHWVASEILCGVEPPTVGMTAPNGVVLDLEMIESAGVYVDMVRHVAGNGTQLQVECQLQSPYVHEQCYGTTDCWFSLPGKRELHVWDYKYGFGIVEPYENYQMICYVGGILYLLGIDGYQEQDLDVVMHIVQPRPFHATGPHRTWRCKATDLRGYYNRLADAANRALGPNPQCQSGNHCKYCSARHACPSAQRAALHAIDYAGQAVPECLTPEALAIELRTMQRAANAISYRLTALSAQAESIIKAGGLVPGWALQQGQGRAAWTRPAVELFALGDLMGIDLRAEPAAVTPAVARKKGLPAELLSAYSAPGDSGVKLIPFENTLASRVFRS